MISKNDSYQPMFDVLKSKVEVSPLQKLLIDTFLVVLASFAIVWSAQIYIPLSFTPVPITAQTLAILTISSFLGSKRAPISVLLYLMYGILGFGVFAEGKSGVNILIGATGGYLIGFVLSAYVVGKFCEKGWDRTLLKSLVSMFIGQFLIFVPGLLWLGQYVGYSTVLEKGLYPFIIGGLIKTFLGASTSVVGWKLISQFNKGK